LLLPFSRLIPIEHADYYAEVDFYEGETLPRGYKELSSTTSTRRRESKVSTLLMRELKSFEEE